MTENNDTTKEWIFAFALVLAIVVIVLTGLMVLVLEIEQKNKTVRTCVVTLELTPEDCRGLG